MPKKPPPGYPHLPGGGPGPGTGKPGPKPGPTTGPATLATPSPSLSAGGGTSGGGGFGGGAPDANPELLVRGTGPNPEFVMRDFTAGMHCNPSRDAIPEQDLWWLENLQPLASGNLITVQTANNFAGNSETSLPFYSAQVFVGGVPAVFSAFPDGSAYITYLSSSLTTQIMAPGTLSTTAGSVAATTYLGSTAGFLIVSKTGYWDYGVTAANTLTSLSGGITGGTVTTKNSVAGGTALKQVSTGTGTGTVIQAHYQVISASINAAGTGYNLGDILSLTDNNPVTAAQITVTQLGAGNSIAAIQLTISGDYPGPTTSALVNTGPSGTVVTGGGGTGATFHITIQEFKLVVVSAGAGWTGSPPTLTNETAAPVVVDKWNLSIGLTQGTSIAVYAGRVWIGYLNTLSYTDINQYNSFANAGGSSTFADAYLGGEGITALYSANNYLYMFANAAVDVISNVQVSTQTGLTTFSRVNVLQGLGVSHFCTMSITGFARGVSFMDTSGYYLLAGATPERISDRWQAVVRSIPPSTLVSAAVFNLYNELCLGVLCTIVDTFSQVGPQTRVVMFVYQRHRWWVHSSQWSPAQSLTSYGPIVGVPNSGLYTSFNFPAPTLFVWALQASGGTANLLQEFFGTNCSWIIRTKLWDGAAAHREKQPLNVAMGVIYASPTGNPLQTFTFSIDTEGGSSPALALPGPGIATSGYFLSVFKGLANQTSTQVFPTVYGAQYIGLTLKGAQFTVGGGIPVINSTTIESIALRGKQERNILE